MHFLRIAGKYLEQLNEKDCPLFLAEERDFWIRAALREFMEENCV
jgi:DNA-directed RNA polymerase subunit K/omega